LELDVWAVGRPTIRGIGLSLRAFRCLIAITSQETNTAINLLSATAGLIPAGSLRNFSKTSPRANPINATTATNTPASGDKRRAAMALLPTSDGRQGPV
jgi:hypothetical protein